MSYREKRAKRESREGGRADCERERVRGGGLSSSADETEVSALCVVHGQDRRDLPHTYR